MVALAAVLALGCGDDQGAPDGGPGDAGFDVAVADVGLEDVGADAGEGDAGWCVSTECTTRLRFDDTCMEVPLTDYSCDAGSGFYDGVCNAIDECIGTPCECLEGACCDGCHFLARDEECAGSPSGGPNTFCSGHEAFWEIRERYCDGDSAACGERYSVLSTTSGACPSGTTCNDNGVEGMRCRPL